MELKRCYLKLATLKIGARSNHETWIKQMALQCFTSHGLNNFQLFWLDKLTGNKRSVIVWDFAVTWIQNPVTRK